MYAHSERQMILPHEFFLPFGGKLDPNNRWCKLAAMIPWDEVEDLYVKNFNNLTNGNKAFSVRTALGSLIIQEHEGFSDEQLTENVSENPYMQYFIGLKSFKQGTPFDSSLLVHFRKRLGKDVINTINEMIARPNNNKKDDGRPGDGKSSGEDKKAEQKAENEDVSSNAGKLILDASCVPADIHYPTDIWLLNRSREALEEIIDLLHSPHIGISNKPRTYRKNARRDYLRIEKNRKPGIKDIRKAICKQLGYVRRDLDIITNLSEISSFELLDNKKYKNLLVSSEIYRQQLYMYTTKTHKIEDRIVSLHMPYIRPIVRGKTNAAVEFGAKLSVSVVDGYTYMEKLSFDAYNEGSSLIESVESYKLRFGFYPEAVIADKIYRNRENLRHCRELGIRLSGPPLGRPASDAELRNEQKRQETEDSRIRNSVEGKFGEGKRAYGLSRIFTRLEETSETVIVLNLLVMNLEKRLRVLFTHLLKKLYKIALMIRLRVFLKMQLVQ